MYNVCVIKYRKRMNMFTRRDDILSSPLVRVTRPVKVGHRLCAWEKNGIERTLKRRGDEMRGERCLERRLTPRDESTHSPTVTPTASSQQHSPESDRALLLVRVLKKTTERAPPFRNRFFFVDFSVRAQLLHRGLHVHCQGFFNSASKEKQLNVASSISQKPQRVVDDPVHHQFITMFLTVLPSSAALLRTRQIVFPHSSPDFCLEKTCATIREP